VARDGIGGVGSVPAHGDTKRACSFANDLSVLRQKSRQPSKRLGSEVTDACSPSFLHLISAKSTSTRRKRRAQMKYLLGINRCGTIPQPHPAPPRSPHHSLPDPTKTTQPANHPQPRVDATRAQLSPNRTPFTVCSRAAIVRRADARSTVIGRLVNRCMSTSNCTAYRAA